MCESYFFWKVLCNQKSCDSDLCITKCNLNLTWAINLQDLLSAPEEEAFIHELVRETQR